MILYIVGVNKQQLNSPIRGQRFSRVLLAVDWLAAWVNCRITFAAVVPFCSQTTIFRRAELANRQASIRVPIPASGLPTILQGPEAHLGHTPTRIWRPLRLA